MDQAALPVLFPSSEEAHPELPRLEARLTYVNRG
jgi:hypothetical protein